MGLGLIYRTEWTNKEGVDMTFDVYDTAFIDTPADDKVIELYPGASPCRLSVIDNDESKFTPIRAKQCVAQFLSTSQHNLATFITDSADNRFQAAAYSPTEVLFYGFLVLNDMAQEFLDDFTHRTVELTATDGLGLLKDIPLTDDDGKNPKGLHSIIKYISWCLKKTGLTLPINVVNNLRLVDHPLTPGYVQASLHAKTFEDEIGTSINCYDVLSQIIGQECYLTQWKGEWWIRRIDEYENNDLFIDRYDADGVLLDTVEDVRYEKNIGYNEPITLVSPPALVQADRPHAEAKLTFDYNLPREIIDNIDFSQGDFLPLVDPFYPSIDYPTKDDFPTPGLPHFFFHAMDTGAYYRWLDEEYQEVGAAVFDLAEWTLKRDSGSVITTAYIKRVYNEVSNEIERFVLMPGSSVSPHYIESSPVPMHYKDKLTFSFDYHLTTDLTGGGDITVFIGQVRLYGENNTYWTLTNVDFGSAKAGDWVQTNSTFTTTIQYIQDRYIPDTHDEQDWRGISVTSKPLPVSGDVTVCLREHTVPGFHDTYFQNVRFDYLAYINGSYRKYNGQHNRVFRTATGYKAKKDETVYVSDSPKKLFKGAIWDFNYLTGKPYLAGLWYNAAVPTLRAAEGTLTAYNHPLGYIQAFSVWNQYRRSMRLFDASLDGLESDASLPDLMHTYRIVDASVHTTTKELLLLHYEMDLNTCQWRGFFAEVFDRNSGKEYGDNHEFKYNSE